MVKPLTKEQFQALYRLFADDPDGNLERAPYRSGDPVSPGECRLVRLAPQVLATLQEHFANPVVTERFRAVKLVLETIERHTCTPAPDPSLVLQTIHGLVGTTLSFLKILETADQDRFPVTDDVRNLVNALSEATNKEDCNRRLDTGWGADHGD